MSEIGKRRFCPALVLVFFLGSSPALGQVPEQQVIFVHGLFSSPDTWSTWVEAWPSEKPYITADGLLTPGTSSSSPIAFQADQLDQALSGISPGWLMIGHSQGGLVSREHVRRIAPGTSPAIRSLITIATPNQGAPLAARSGELGQVFAGTFNALLAGPCVVLRGPFGCLAPRSVPFRIALAAAIEFVNVLIPEFLPAMEDLTPGSAQLDRLNGLSEPINTATVLVQDPPQAEVFKILTPLAQWSEEEAEEAFDDVIDLWLAISAVAAFVCIRGGFDSDITNACAASPAFAFGAIRLAFSDDDMRSLVTPDRNPRTPADGIVPTASQRIPLLAADRQFDLPATVYHLHQTRSPQVRDFIGLLIETRDDVAVIRAWFETSPVVRFTGVVNGAQLSVDGSGTDNRIGATLEYRWVWGDGTKSPFSTSPTATHTYAIPGTYRVTLRVREKGRNDKIFGTSQNFTIPPVVASVEVTPSSATVEIGQSVALRAVPKDFSGNPVGNQIVTWETSNATLASIAPAGDVVTVTGKALGEVTITATVAGVAGIASVSVVPKSVATVEVAPSSVTVQVGQTAVLAAIPRASDGSPLHDRIVTWQTSDAAVASIAPVGNSVTMTGMSAGTATIRATVEGKTGSASVTVNPQVDNASAAGNSFPGGMLSGGIVSVSLSMSNSGSTTWSTGEAYNLELVRDFQWLPTSVGLPTSVSPGASTTFFFDLRHTLPEVTGFVPAFYRMARSGARFGGENGADILLSSNGCIVCGSLAAETTTLDADPATTWLVEATDGGTSRLALDGAALRRHGAAQVEYVFDHGAPRKLDLVLKFTFDPAVLRPLRRQPGPGAAGLVQTAGLRGAGTYWVRLKGTVPAGRGRIIAFPFRLVPEAEPSDMLGTVTIYYPSR